MRLLDEGIPGIPKKISPQQHRILDYLTIGAFGLAGALMWPSNRRAGIAAFLNAVYILGFTVNTDYDGDGRRPLSFKTRGKLDIVQTG